MASELFVLKPLPDDEVYDGIFIGSSCFNDDVWDMKEYISVNTRNDAQNKIRFKNIKNAEIKNTVKQYAYYKLGKIKPQSVAANINTKLPSFILYCELNGVRDFSELNIQFLLDYMEWMADENKRSERTLKTVISIIFEIVKVGQVKGWKVPSNKQLPKNKMVELIKKRWQGLENKYKPIPEDVFRKILHCALYKEKDILTKAGIVIQSQTGLRISEVLGIKSGCLSVTEEGYDFMEVYISKTEKGEPIAHKVYANELVKTVILELEAATKHLREKSGLQELFINENKGIYNLKVPHWTYDRLNSFVRRWGIRGNDGELYPLKSHQFRATFVRELIKQNVSINHIMKQFSHVSVEMTMHYLTLQEDEIRKIYTDMVLGPDAKIAGFRAAEIKNTLEPYFKGKTTDEIELFISGLSETMSFNPLPNGICLYDFTRGNCTNGDGCFFYNCPNYITEAKFYPILKRELELLELEMSRYELLGRERDWQRQYIKHKYLKKLVDSLEVQLDD